MFKLIPVRLLIITLFLFSFCSCLLAEASLFGKQGISSKKHPKKVSDISEKRKVILVEIYAKWCPLCKNIQPTLDLLLKDVPDIKLIQLDVSTKEKTEESLDIARENDLEEYYLANKNVTGSVAVIVASSREISEVLYNETNLDKYKESIELAKIKEKNLENKESKINSDNNLETKEVNETTEIQESTETQETESNIESEETVNESDQSSEE